jgi:hypothetical protein
MRETAKPVWMTGAGFGQCVVIVPCQRDALGTWDDVGPWAGDRKHLHGDPAGIHICQARVTEVGQLVPLDDLSPDDIRPGKTAAADGGRVDATDKSRNSIMLFQRNYAQGVSP